MIFALPALLTGFAAAVVCVGGLALGAHMLMSTAASTELEPFQRQLRFFLGAVVLVAQFFGAMAILYFSPATRTQPLGVGAGLALTLLLVCVIAAYAKIGRK